MSTSTVSTATMSTSTANPNPAETAFIDELDAIEVLEVGDLAGRSFAHLLIASMVEGSWPRIPTQVEGGWDPRELVAAGVLPHERDQITIARHRAFFADTVARGEISVTAIAAPDPGVLVSRFVEGWPELPTVSLHTEGPLLPESPETRSQVACFPDDSLRLSATRLDTFENCRLNFAYQYVAGVRGPGGVPASVGTMVHATLEAFLLPMAEVTAHEQTEVEARGGATRERLFELLETNWESSAFPYRPQEADYRRRAEDWLERWLETEFPRLQRVIAVEHRFSVRVGQHTLTGSIDRVSVNTDGEVEIVDYKTGSAPRTSNRTDPDNLQLATYHLAAVTDPVLQAFGEPKRLRLHYLAAGADVDQPVRADHEAVTKARILAAADAIATEDFYPSVEADCEYCNFKKLCPIQPEGRTIESLRSEKSRPTTGVAASAPAATARRKRTVIAEAPYPVSGVAVVNANDLRADQSVDPIPPTQTNTAQDAAEVDNGFQPLPEQTRAIEHVGSPLLIVAGAGSGKTTVLAKRIVNLVRNHGWRPDQILGLTFSNKASGNLRARVAKELGTGNDAVVMTYHGFGATILRQYGERIGLPTEPILLDRARAWQLLLDSLDDVRIESRKTGNIGLLVNDALALSSSCADHVVSVRAVRAECEWMLNTAALHKGATKTLLDRIDLCAMAEAYELAKRATGCIDFGDQIRLALQLVEEHGDVAETLRNTFPVALLDEYQDTNYAQRRLIEVLYRGSNELTAVGDDMQSIYGFRGAHIRNLLSFESHFPGATECRLETNHRSGPEIVALAEHIQGQVDNARPKQLIASGRIPIAHIERFIAADDFEEAQQIANRCLQLHAEGQSWSEIAILCRKRRLIAPISETLMAAGVPVEVFGLGGLLQRPEIIDAISWLEIVAAPEGQVPPAPRGEANASNGKLAPPDPSVSLLRILRSEPYRLGMRDLAALSRAARNWARANGSDQNDMLDILVALNELSETADLSTEAWTRLHAFNTVRVPLVEARDRQPLADFVEMVLDRTGIWRRVDARGYENLTRFVDLAARFVALPIAGRGSWFGRRSLLEFLEYLELIALSDDELSEAVGSDVDAVNIMTIHQAKGLEFETVFVPGLAGKAGSRSKIFPDGRAGENGITQAVALPPWMKGDADRTPPPLRSTSDLEAPKIEADRERDREEKRLFYVAATRAKSRVILSTAHWYAGVMQPQGPSPFYDLLGETVPPVVETSRSAPPLQDPKIAEMERRNDRYRAEMSMNANRDNSDPVTPDRRSRRGKSGGGATPQGSLFLSEVGANERPAILIPLPNAFATTSLVTYARCPRRFFWTTIRPLPRRASDAARIGTEVHKWIEQQANGQLSLGSLEATPDGLEPSPMNEMNGVDADPDSGEVDPESNEIELIDFIDFIDALAMPREEASGPVGVSGAPVTGSPASGSRGSVARAAYAQSRYANRIPRHVEMPFAIAFEGRVVRGRVDAIYNAHDLGPSNRSSVEIVDFKTGHAPGNSMSGCHPTDPALIDTEPTTIQLDVYGLVAVQVLGFRPDEITVTACYLGGDAGPQYRSRAWTTEEARLANDRVIAALEAIANRRFDPAPGDWCSHCDFESFCEKAATRRTV